MAHEHNLVLVRPTAIALKCETPVGIVALVWEQNEDTGVWEGSVNLHCAGLDGGGIPHIHQVPMDEIIGGMDMDTGQPVSTSADDIITAAAHMASIATTMQDDYDRQAFGSLGN